MYGSSQGIWWRLCYGRSYVPTTSKGSVFVGRRMWCQTSDRGPLHLRCVAALREGSSRQGKKGQKLTADNPELDDDELDALLGDNGSGHEDGDKERGDGEEDGPASKDALRKALVLVKQIRMSPQAQRFFKKKCAETGVPVIQLLGWIRTRGASMFTFLDHLILLRAAVNRFVHLADNHGEHIIKIHEVLQDLANTSRPRIHGGNLGANMAATENFEHMQDSINAGLENLEKWFGKTDNTDVYFRWIRPSKRLSLSDRALHKIDDYYVATTAEVVVAAAATSE
ncbi:hypothetical protein DFH06DRAFT_1142882 [Mycena polygramma]|nr:hypothetical protein DFH06DRAFT_1142882 [Mycena polygramma]